LRRFGFTFIELLAVNAIVAALAALAVPIFLSVRERGRQEQCASQLRQIGIALNAYAQSWDEVLPGLNLKPALDSLLGDRSVWLCPSNPVGENAPWDRILASGAKPAMTSRIWMEWPYAPYSYAPSRALFQSSASAGESPSGEPNVAISPARPLAEIPDPSSVIAVYESAWYSDFPHSWGTRIGLGARVMNDVIGEVDLGKILPVWHHGGGEWLFADGHARWMKPRQTLLPRALWMPVEAGSPVDSPDGLRLDAERAAALLDQFPQYR
jgi:prepilin-type N-terminal cleavage/methylation domain-containing protein